MLSTLERKPLGQLLLDRKLIRPEHLESALAEQRRTNHQKLLGEILVELQACREDQVAEALAQTYGVPFARVSPKLADPKVIAALPKEFLEKNQVLPLFLVENVLTVAVPEPANVFLIEEIERVSGRNVQVVAATVADIQATLRAYLPEDKAFVIDELVDELRPDAVVVVRPDERDHSESDFSGDDPAVIKLVNYILFSAVKENAGDVHFEPMDEVVRVRFRLDGRLVEKLRPPHAMHGAVAARLKTLAGLDVEERSLPQEASVRMTIDGRPVELHVGTFPGKSGEKVVVRIADSAKAAAKLERLGFSYDTLKQWRKLIARPSGIILVTGPAGSGKATTLCASLQELVRDDSNVCTVEDPIRRTLEGVNQFQVNESGGFGFAAAVRAVLRQDPDVLMISDLSDGETARLAAQSVLTGRLVLAAMHAADAPGAVARLAHLGVEPYVAGASLAGVLSQRLVRKLCQTCKEPATPTVSERRQLEKHGMAAGTLFRARGCQKCRNIGYSGRVGIHELLVPGDDLSERIAAGISLRELREAAIAAGMRPLRTDGIEKVKSGITTLEEVYRVTA